MAICFSVRAFEMSPLYYIVAITKCIYKYTLPMIQNVSLSLNFACLRKRQSIFLLLFWMLGCWYSFFSLVCGCHSATHITQPMLHTNERLNERMKKKQHTSRTAKAKQQLCPWPNSYKLVRSYCYRTHTLLVCETVKNTKVIWNKVVRFFSINKEIFEK